MRPQQKNRNARNKSGRGGNKPLGNVVNRVFESNGPEGKVRGTPQQIIDKYHLLARDAQTASDRVMAENFLQHAEHYARMLSEAMEQAEERRQQQPAPPRSQGEGAEDGENRQERREDWREPREARREPHEARREESEARREPQEERREESEARSEAPAREAPRRRERPRETAEVAPQVNGAAALETIDTREGEESGPVQTPEETAPEPPRRRRSRRTPKKAEAETVEGGESGAGAENDEAAAS